MSLTTPKDPSKEAGKDDKSGTLDLFSLEKISRVRKLQLPRLEETQLIIFPVLVARQPIKPRTLQQVKTHRRDVSRSCLLLLFLAKLMIQLHHLHLPLSASVALRMLLRLNRRTRHP